MCCHVNCDVLYGLAYSFGENISRNARIHPFEMCIQGQNDEFSDVCVLGERRKNREKKGFRYKS